MDPKKDGRLELLSSFCICVMYWHCQILSFGHIMLLSMVANQLVSWVLNKTDLECIVLNEL